MKNQRSYRQWLLMVALLVFVHISVRAQESSALFGYLSYSEALAAMPKYALVKQQMAQLRQQYDSELQRVTEEFNRKYEEFLDGRRDFPPSILRKRQMELQELMEKNVAFKTDALRELSEAEASAMAPLRETLDKVLNTIGQQRGYALIVNTDGNACPYINPMMGEDISSIVAAKVREND
jgi:outer membrane protein